MSRFETSLKVRGGAVWSARRAHNPEVVGSNPAPATSLNHSNILFIFAVAGFELFKFVPDFRENHAKAFSLKTCHWHVFLTLKARDHLLVNFGHFALQNSIHSGSRSVSTLTLFQSFFERIASKFPSQNKMPRWLDLNYLSLCLTFAKITRKPFR